MGAGLALVPFGPVPLSRVQAEAGHITRALADGQRAVIARRGEAVAVIDPVDVVPQLFLAAHASGVDVVDEISAREFSRGNISQYVSDAADGHPRLLTRSGRIVGALRALFGPADFGGVDADSVDALNAATLAVLERLGGSTDGDAAMAALAGVSQSFASTEIDEARLESIVDVAARRGAESESSSAVPDLGAAALVSSLSMGPTHPVSLVAQNNLLVRLVQVHEPMVWMGEAMRSIAAAVDDVLAVDDVRVSTLHDNAATVAALVASRDPSSLRLRALNGGIVSPTVFRLVADWA